MDFCAEASDTSEMSPTRRGIVELICGCMFSGKTTALLEILRDEPADVIAIFKHNKDRRYAAGQIVTHDGQGCQAQTVTCSTEILEHVPQAAQVVAIDEGHFYDDELPDVCRRLAGLGKRVIVTALDLDMWGLPFGSVDRIREIAGVVRVQQGCCACCGKPATHTYRKTPLVGKNLVGGADDFEPRCGACWSPPPENHVDSDEMV